MSDFRNEEGEYLMTAAELRLEYELDQQSAYERYYDEDDYYGGYEPDVAPEDCGHGDGTYTGEAGYDCDICGETFQGPRTAPWEDDLGILWGGDFFTKH